MEDKTGTTGSKTGITDREADITANKTGITENDRFKVSDSVSYRIGDPVLYKKTKTFLAVLDKPEYLIMHFTDLVKSDDGKKAQEIVGKGKVCATINNVLFALLAGKYIDVRQEMPIRTHFIASSPHNPTDCLVQRMVGEIPLEVLIRNAADGSFVERYGIKQGTVFPRPYCEFTLKNDNLHDPMVNDDYIKLFEIATKAEIEVMRDMALAACRIITAFFAEINIDLIDAKLVFGRSSEFVGDVTSLRLVGELSPDSFRLRDHETGQELDKDIFRKELPGLLEAYKIVEQKILAGYAEQREFYHHQFLGNAPK